jgi:hypothetical protein
MPILTGAVEALCTLIALTYLSLSVPTVRPTLAILAPCHLAFCILGIYRTPTRCN